jgi:N-acetylglucosaminyl-diphospho-decaprenol L-rhamnosyltransferase
MINENNIKSITIVIVLFKESFEIINKTLEHIKDFKIIIIDNANNHDLKKEITKKFQIYKYILNKKNNGFSAGYNQGIKISEGKYTLVLNPDCIISKKNINILIKKLEYYQGVIIAVPTAYDNNNQLTYSGGLLPENGKKDIILNLDGDACVESALGACMLFKTDEFRKYDLLFDENFFLYFSDDDLCRKIKSINKSIIQTKDAICTHQHGFIKVRNIYHKTYIREFNYTYDMLYYFYKSKTKKTLEIIGKLRDKTKNYYILIIIRLITFNILDVVKLYSRLSAFNKFKKKYINNIIR